MSGLLTIMGSGETAPTMVKVHRRLVERVGATGPGDAVLLDTPYGFQENADDISARAQEYFARSVGHPIRPVDWRRPDDDIVQRERSLAAVADARYVFAGPGSPTYALGVWRDTPLLDLLIDTVARGGAVTFASAAALTLGRRTVPVYEIYKVGMAPRWEDGLDLLASFGLPVAVIPHYDNNEGGNHDTRFCYLGERRLALLERDLPEGCWVLGVDEHTALVLDLGAGTATVEGNGQVTVRLAGASTVFEAGTELELGALRPGPGPSPAAPLDRASDRGEGTEPTSSGPAPLGLAEAVERLSAAFDSALVERRVEAAVGAVLDLEQTIVDWSADTLQSDENDRARAALRRMVVRLGELALVGARDEREVIGPFVDAVLAARAGVRDAGRYALADELRDVLVAAGVEVRDTPAGAEWVLLAAPD